MDFFTHPLVAALILLGILVIVHEGGHYLVGRWLGIGVHTFSVGFGPPIFAKKIGQTLYQVGAIPLGGYVRFFGELPGELHESNEEDDYADEQIQYGMTFDEAPRYAKALTIFAGPFFNLLLAWLVYTFLAAWGIPVMPAVVGQVFPETPAAEAGLQSGDTILEIDGQKIETWMAMQAKVSTSPGQPLQLTVLRDGEQRTMEIVPEDAKGVGKVGIGLGQLAPLIEVVDETSPFFMAGLRTGDRILEVDEEEVLTLDAFRDRLAKRFRADLSAEGPADSMALEVESLDGTSKILEVNLDQFEDKSKQAFLENKDLPLLGARPGALVVKEPYQSKLETGDVVVAWNEVPMENYLDWIQIQQENRDPQAVLAVKRGQEIQEVTLELKPVDEQTVDGTRTLYVFPGETLLEFVRPPLQVMQADSFWAAIEDGLDKVAGQSAMIVGGIWMLISGEVSLKALGGPIMIGKVAGDAAKAGWQMFLLMMGVISINLAIFNLFPIPVLDGGQLFILGMEAVYRRPLPVSLIEGFRKIGFVMILTLLVLAFYNDLSRFWRPIVEGLGF